MEIVVVGEDGDSLFVRRIAEASQVDGEGAYSDLVEAAVRERASTLGLADFVCRPVIASKGNATRELSDGLLVVADVALVLQTKARQSTESGRAAREEAWLRKTAAAAERQVGGTVRSIRRAGEVSFVTGRGDPPSGARGPPGTARRRASRR